MKQFAKFKCFALVGFRDIPNYVNFSTALTLFVKSTLAYLLLIFAVGMKIWSDPFDRKNNWADDNQWLWILFISCIVVNARAQRSWQRRLWHRPRTPSPSSWRLQHGDTIRARITIFGPEVKLDERSPDTKFDVTGYFRSLASGRFVNYFSNGSNISGTAQYKCTKFGQAIDLNIFYIFSKFDGSSLLCLSV